MIDKSLELEQNFISFILNEQKKQGLMQKDIARASGLSEATVSRIMRGNGLLTLKTVQQIAAALGYTVSIEFKPNL